MLKLVAMACGLLGLVWLTAWTDQLTGNLSPSAPKGFHVQADPETARYVTFCLRRDQSGLPFYPRFCSPDNPDGQHIIKRITIRHEDGSLSVKGLVPRSIFSAVLGRIRPRQVRGYWRHIRL